MPIYVLGCPCGHTEEVYRSIAEIDKDLPSHCDQVMTRRVVAPMVLGDIPPYRSMCDGTMITSRSQHRAHLKQHGVIEIGNEKIKERPNTLGKTKGLKETLIEVVNAKL